MCRSFEYEYPGNPEVIVNHVTNRSIYYACCINRYPLGSQLLSGLGSEGRHITPQNLYFLFSGFLFLFLHSPSFSIPQAPYHSQHINFVFQLCTFSLWKVISLLNLLLQSRTALFLKFIFKHILIYIQNTSGLQYKKKKQATTKQKKPTRKKK